MSTVTRLTNKDYFSEALNNNYTDDVVDPRTGSIIKHYVLAQLPLEPMSHQFFKLQLMYRPDPYPQKKTHTFIALSWILHYPRIQIYRIAQNNDFGAGLIYLSDGSTRTVRVNNDGLYLYGHKVTDCKLEKKSDVIGNVTYEYYVYTHKNGVKEYFKLEDQLNRDQWGGTLSKVVSPLGHSLTFEYEAPAATISPLKKIRDDKGNYIEITYSNSEVDINTYYSNQQQIKNTKLVLMAGKRLDRIIYDGENPITHNFTYEDKEDTNQYVLSQHSDSWGNDEHFEYTKIKYSDAIQDYSEEISIYVANRITNGEESIELAYGGDGNNFLGYRQDTMQISGIDNCMEISEDYQYTTTETRNIGTQFGRTYLRIYNRFHLLVKKVYFGQPYKRKEFQYTLKSGGVSDQAIGYFLRKQVAEYISDRPNITLKSYINTYEYDEYGNVTSHIDENGIKINRQYLSLEDTKSINPEENIVKYLTSEKTNAISGNNQKINSMSYIGVQGKIYRNPYTGVNITPKAILIDLLTENETLKTSFSYQNGTGRLLHLRNFNESDQNLLSIDFSYHEDITSVTKIETYSFDDVQNSKHTKINIITGQTEEELALNGMVNKYEYNNLGQLTKTTKNTNTKYQRIEEFNYQTQKNIAGETFNSVSLTFNNIFYEKLYNRKGELVYEKVDDYIIHEYKFDPYGNTISKKTFDRVLNVDTEKEIKYMYDSIDNVTRRTNFNGTVESNEYIYNEHEMIIRTTSSDTSEIIEIVRNDIERSLSIKSNNILMQKLSYDGFLRMNELNDLAYESSVTTYQYDLFDRVVNESKKNFYGDNNIEQYHYLYQNEFKDNIKSITVSGLVDNPSSPVRSFDKQGRIISEVTSGARKEYSYDNDYTHIPTHITLNARDYYQSTTDLNKLVQETIHTLPLTSNLHSTYDYEYEALGNISKVSLKEFISSSESPFFSFEKDMVYNKQGFEISNSQTFDTHKYLISKTRSASGIRLLTRRRDYMNVEEKFSYDKFGRVISKKYEGIDIQIDCGHNKENGNISKIALWYGIKQLLDIRIHYDDKGLESNRVVKYRGEQILQINNRHDDYSNIIMRHISGEYSQISNEEFDYTGARVLKRSIYNDLEHDRVNISDYSFLGMNRVNSVKNSMKGDLSYSYQSDIVKELSIEGFQNLTYDVSESSALSPTGSDYQYDSKNRLRVASSHGHTYHYSYDNEGNIIQNKYVPTEGNNQSVQYIYDEGNLIGEIDGQNKAAYLDISGISLGRYIQTSNSSYEIELDVPDGQGTVYCRIFDKHQIVQNIKYDDYGNIRI
ncbi:hypothetical protein AB4431_02665 [Vibrio artabrorum]|uniref:hypothetical protein n=1 Tax=Vibrio artabrorum TaxID=446374 RepID=UPI0035523312